MATVELPLFPLRTVLFPGGELRLRIFEPRYVDLVRRCTRAQSCFGVSLILDGEEAGSPALPAAIGTSARICDFYTLPDGMLGITVSGEQRYHVASSRARDDGLILAGVDFIDDPPTQPLRAEHGLLSQLLDRVLGRIGGEHDRFERCRLDDADWVGWRLAEVLPLENRERQELLQTGDAHRRLDRIAEWLPRFQRE